MPHLPHFKAAKGSHARGSTRTLRETFTRSLYRRDRHVVLCDVDTRETHLSFAQPIATERLVVYDLADLEAPLECEAPLTLEIRKSPAQDFQRATIEHQSAAGLVRWTYDDGTDEWLGLACYEHRWVQPAPLPAPWRAMGSSLKLQSQGR